MKFPILTIFLVLLCSFLPYAFSAPIPEGAVFWIAYDDSLGGYGDQMMAEKLKNRIEALGYFALTYPFSRPPSLAEYPAPSLIVAVPHAHSVSLLSHVPVRVGVLQECGYAPTKRSPSLGIPAAMLTEAAAHSSGSSWSAAHVLREEGEEYFQGLLLDQELMSLYREDPLKSPAMRVKAYLMLSSQMRSQLDSLLGLNTASSPEEIANSLQSTDLYFGYSHIIFSQQYFTTLVEGIATSVARRPLVILTGGDLDSRLREGRWMPELTMSASPGSKASVITKEATVGGGSAIREKESDSSLGTSALVEHESTALSPVEYYPRFFKHPQVMATDVSDPVLIRINRVDHSDFKLLLYLSSLALVTGDRSTEEAISAGVPMIYEVLRHKRGFAHQLQSITPSGLITPLRMVGESMHSVNTYDRVIKSGKLFGMEYRVSSIVHAQSLLADPKDPIYSQFFLKMHEQAYMSDSVLRSFLETWFDDEEIYPGLPELGFELGKKYHLKIDDMVALQISTQHSKSMSPAVCAKYQLSADHQFNVSALCFDGFIVTLEVK